MVINTIVESKYIKLNSTKNKFNRFNINPEILFARLNLLSFKKIKTLSIISKLQNKEIQMDLNL